MDDAAGGHLDAAGVWRSAKPKSRRGWLHLIMRAIPVPADRVPAAATVIATLGTASLLEQHGPVPAGANTMLPFLLLALVFGLSGRLVGRSGPGAFPIVVAIRSFGLFLGLLMTSANLVITAHAVGGILAAIVDRPHHAWPPAARLSMAVYGTALGATLYGGVLTGAETYVVWWAAAFAAVLVASLLGSMGMAIEWLANGTRLSRRSVLLATLAVILIAATVASVGLMAVILASTDPAELLLLAGPALVAIMASVAYAAQRDRNEQMEFIYRSAHVFDGASSGGAMLTKLLEGMVVRFDAQRAEIVLDRIGDRPLRASVTSAGVVQAVAPVEADVAARALELLPPSADDMDRGALVIDGDPLETRAIVRIVAASRPVGLLVVIRGQRQRWKAAELRLLEGVAANLGAALGTGRMVEELAASADQLERLAALVTASDDAIIGVRPNGTISSWNRGAEVLFGRMSTEVVNKAGDTLGTVVGYSGLREAFARARHGELVRDVHADATRRDGSVVPIAVTMSPIQSHDGHVWAVSIIARDETPQALQTTALRESLDRFQRVFEGSPVGIGVIGQDFTWVRVNDALCRALGVPEEELVAHRFERSLVREDIESAHGVVSRLLRGETEGSSVEVRLRPIDPAASQPVIAAFTVRPLRTGDAGVQALCTMEDVTEWRRAEERGRATDEMVKAAILEMTAIRDPRGIILVLLGSVRRIVSATAAVVVYRDPDDPEHPTVIGDGSPAGLQLLEPHTRPSGVRSTVVTDGGPTCVTSGDSRQDPAHLSVALATESIDSGSLHVAGKADGSSFTDADRAVVIALAAQASLSLENARAHQLALALVRELDEANVALQQASEAKTRFLANVSHELRTPLHSILLAARLLDGDGKPTDRQRVTALPGVIEASGQYLLGLIDDLVDLAQMELTDVRLRFTNVRLDTVLDDLRQQLRPLAAERGLHLRIASGRGIEVFADPLRLRQVLINLLTNAIKYTETGGRVVLEARLTPDGRLLIAVRDTGIGIDPADIERAFEPFERLGRDGVSGAGLGLAIARRIVELHGGRLTARSRPGRGSTFTVSLSGSMLPAAPPQDAVPAKAPGEGKTILVVDDDPIALGLMSAVLDHEGYGVVTAATLRDARARMVDSDIDAVVLDRRLPDGDGLQLLIPSEGAPKAYRVPVITVSASATDVATAASAGVADHLRKPVAVDQLLDRLAVVTGHPAFAQAPVAQ